MALHEEADDILFAELSARQGIRAADAFEDCLLYTSGGEHSVPFNALTLPQDTGGAIKRNRVDLFCGNGETATHTASYLDNRGAVFLLLPR